MANHNHNLNHFTGKKKPFQTPRRKFGKVKTTVNTKQIRKAL